MPLKEPQWKLFCVPNRGSRAFAAVVTRANYRRALKDARREALLSAAESCRECAHRLRLFPKAAAGADHWDEAALWLEKRAGHPERQPAREGATDAR